MARHALWKTKYLSQMVNTSTGSHGGELKGTELPTQVQKEEYTVSTCHAKTSLPTTYYSKFIYPSKALT